MTDMNRAGQDTDTMQRDAVDETTDFDQLFVEHVGDDVDPHVWIADLAERMDSSPSFVQRVASALLDEIQQRKSSTSGSIPTQQG